MIYVSCAHHISVVLNWEINYSYDVILCKLAYNHASHSNVPGLMFPGMPVSCHHLDTAVIIYYTQHQLGAGTAISRHHPTIKSNIGASGSDKRWWYSALWLCGDTVHYKYSIANKLTCTSHCKYSIANKLTCTSSMCLMFALLDCLFSKEIHTTEIKKTSY